MLKDERARALGSNFAGQWLYLRNLRGLQPDADVFPDFDHNLREALQRETEMLFESIVLEDKPRDHAAQRGLHVPQRAAGAPLRRAEHLRHTVPPRRGDERGAQGPAGTRQHPGADVAEQPDVAGAARQVRADEHPRARRRRRRRRSCRRSTRTREKRSPCATAWKSTARARPARAATNSWIRSGWRSRTSTALAAGGRWTTAR